MSEPPAVSVVVASHGRQLRLRWLLNALEEQTFDGRGRSWSSTTTTLTTARRVIDAHPLAARGRPPPFAIEPGTGSPSRQRNIGWRAARAPLDRLHRRRLPPETRLARRSLLAVARPTPGPMRAGSDPPRPARARSARRAARADPVHRSGRTVRQTCNILYPRALLERLDGFDEHAIAGEDVGLSLRARAPAQSRRRTRGVVNHAIESHTLPGILRQNLKWRHLAYLVKRHPGVPRRADAAALLGRRPPARAAGVLGLSCASLAVLALAAPYAIKASRRRGPGPARGIAIAELPGQAARQLAEVVGMAAGSIRHRTLALTGPAASGRAPPPHAGRPGRSAAAVTDSACGSWRLDRPRS